VASEERVELGVDGNCGFALLGVNIQEGEAEFVEFVEFDDSPDYGTNEELLGRKLSACKEALAKLRKRLNRPDLNYYFGDSHPYGK
jgi:hypothetical protein